ncbi:uncharacterized protein EI90DRAFT_3013025 [Cantharellus anzutake]|uniref:uncharacterized protein n=1 Tax=Cantharellus anzutake TaxID=1750568 RepID=UPI001908F7D7|nr:uncharacterized protein EI90DRAFT_3013025 [Cantharellus anzutake]KAF8338903.1 hypothetical protein EI90DRAFT_3013025 [Cantharellus anzutake]
MSYKHDLNYYVLNKDKRAHWNDDHIMGLAPRPLPKTPQQAFQQYLLRGHALFLPDDSDRVLDALDSLAHDLPPENWTILFPPNWDALPLDNPTRINCEAFIVPKQKAEQEKTRQRQLGVATANVPSVSAATMPFPAQSPSQAPYTAYPIAYPIVPFPNQPQIFLTQQTAPSPPAPMTSKLASDVNLQSKSQSDEKEPNKMTMEASLYLLIDSAATFALSKVEEGMGVDVTKHEIGYLPTFDGKRRRDMPVQLKTAVHMEKALHELRDCMSRARSSKKLYVINMKPVPKSENVGKHGKTRRTNTVNSAIQSNPASDQYVMLEKQWECHGCGGHCWPHTRAKGKHLHLDNAMLSLWAQQWSDGVTGVDLHNPPVHNWFDVLALEKQTKAVNQKRRQESRKRKRNGSPPRTPTKPGATAIPKPLVKKAKVDVTPAKQQPVKDTIILSSDPITPPFLSRILAATQTSKVGTDIINLSSSPTPGPSKKKDPAPTVFDLCSDSSADDFLKHEIEYDELES